MLIFKGMVGVVGVLFVVVLIILGLMGLFLEGMVFIVGIDCILDMFCIFVNVVGNVLVVIVMFKWEGGFDKEKVKYYIEFIRKLDVV